MEEIVPLEASNKKEFESTVAGIKKLIKTGKFVVPNKKDKSKGKPQALANKGVVYIGHIPHGFYEKEMLGYFKQFGRVTNVRIARSSKNGKSKGYGFIEFADREVAAIVAETMNNYLMDKRLLKAEVIAPEREMPNLFKGKNWTERKHCPGLKNRKTAVNQYNKNITHDEWISESKKQLKKLHKTQSKLQALGIEFIFTPSDVPAELIGYDPSAESKASTSKSKSEDIFSDNESVKKDESTDSSPPPKQKKNKKIVRKEKSMNKPTSPLVKAPKVKKLGKNLNIPSVESTPIFSPKNTRSKSKIVELDESVEEPKQKLLQKKNFGGIQKKKTGKDRAPISRRVFSDNAEVKAQAKKILQSNLIKVIKKNDILKSDKKSSKNKNKKQ